MRHFWIILFVLMMCYPVSSVSSDGDNDELRYPQDGFIQILTTVNGTTVIGRITDLTDTTVEFTTDFGIVTIPRSEISELRTVPLSEIRDGSYWFPDPNSTRLYFAPTGRMLTPGSGYIADYYLFFPAFNYGITPKLSLGGGLSIFPTGNMANQIYYLTPKVSIRQTERLHIAAGALIIKFPDFDEEDSPLVSVLYGAGTYGTSDMSVTCGLGYGMVDTELAHKPMLVIGGEKRLTRRLAFVTENWIFPGVDNALISYGIRFLNERFTTDFALLNTTGEDALFPGIPYIDFVYNF